jgi:hypothetical protein
MANPKSPPRPSTVNSGSAGLRAAGNKVSAPAADASGRIAKFANSGEPAVINQIHRDACEHAPEVGIEGVAGKTGTTVLPIGHGVGAGVKWRG